MTKPKPMQTHGLFDETWHPPVSRSKFVTYTKDDEHWLRPMGLGHVKKTIRNLFDVRLNDRTLVGYVDIDPTKSDCPWLQLPMILPSSVYDDPMLAPGRREYRRVTMYVELLRVRVSDMQLFSCWTLESALDASLLVQVGFITLIGEDNLHRWSSELRRKHCARQERFCSLR
ncbi:hypothetical protein UFOVP1229_124 [uncultured Caudovirales phage]|uniref:Uncharacterized protein n=1 Tax=uncultured Caudovirales phage TaxID=2100421 RepID=A0A6J5RB24_9CAUD|nr:hypothetical protein UFOVP1229_124 [uncultured Caudovirales phage]